MENQRELFSLQIGYKKLNELKKKKTKVVSHPETRRWKDFKNKSYKKVRFYDVLYGNSETFDVKTIKTTINCGKTIIKIEII